jgi:hydroxypyruvate isomerase
MDSNRLKASAGATTLFDGMSMSECVTIAEAAGFSALEFQLLDGSDAEHFAPLIEAKGLEVTLINLDLGDF